jgi:protein-S-isoprenylcysteine O-methyltransferase Ste14
MTVLMRATEEKWLKNLYGEEYEEYCRQVNQSKLAGFLVCTNRK